MHGEVLNGEAGRYRLIEEVGKGGFGTTYRAENVDSREQVAVKELRFDRIEDWKAVELFDREAETLAALEHPSIPDYVDNFVLRGSDDAAPRFVLVQEFVEGTTLDAVVRERREVDDATMRGWFRQLLEVCDYLHRLSPPVIHRDISPKNIVLQEDGSACLIDFGTVQARVLEEGNVGSTSAGTFGYAAMEQFVGRAVPASDLYSLAMTYLAVRSGMGPEQMPFDGNRVDVPATLQASPTDPALVDVLEAMTEPDPRARPQSAREVLDGLDGASAESTPPSPRALAPAAPTLPSAPRDGSAGEALVIDVLRDGAVAETREFTGDSIDVGRDANCDLPIRDATLSRRHATIERSGDAWVVTDLNSSNGVRRNGVPVTTAELHHGDEVQFGDVTTRVRFGTRPEDGLSVEVVRGGVVQRVETFDRDVIKIGQKSMATVHVRLDDPDVARIHAVIERHADGGWAIVDFGSSAGTFVNGEPVSKSTLHPGDEILVGDTTLRVHFQPNRALVPSRGTQMKVVERNPGNVDFALPFFGAASVFSVLILVLVWLFGLI